MQLRSRGRPCEVIRKPQCHRNVWMHFSGMLPKTAMALQCLGVLCGRIPKIAMPLQCQNALFCGIIGMHLIHNTAFAEIVDRRAT